MITCSKHQPKQGKPCEHYIEADIDGCAAFCALPDMYHCTESLKTKLPCISHTTACNLAHCNMSVYYSTLCGIGPKDDALPNAVKMGKAWDAFLDDAANGRDCAAGYYTLNLYEESAAKAEAMIRAFNTLAMRIYRGETQPERFIKLSNGILTTHADRYYQGCIDKDNGHPSFLVESKFTSRPENYLSVPLISHQVGSYFLAHEDCEFVVMEVAVVPAQKLGKNEDIEDYTRRIYEDILARPAHYFRGYNKERHTFGKVFYRSEFDLEDLKRTYERQLDELRWRIDNNAWYEHPARIHCDSPTQCWYKPICDNGRISEELFYIKQKEHKRNG